MVQYSSYMFHVLNNYRKFCMAISELIELVSWCCLAPSLPPDVIPYIQLMGVYLGLSFLWGLFRVSLVAVMLISMFLCMKLLFHMFFFQNLFCQMGGSLWPKVLQPYYFQVPDLVQFYYFEVFWVVLCYRMSSSYNFEAYVLGFFWTAPDHWLLSIWPMIVAIAFGGLSISLVVAG